MKLKRSDVRPAAGPAKATTGRQAPAVRTRKKKARRGATGATGFDVQKKTKQAAPVPASPGAQPLPSLPLGDGALAADDLPGNQPTARFAGRAPALARPADPLPAWLGGPLNKRGVIMTADPGVAWRQKAVFNPTALVKDGKVFMLFRGQDLSGAGKWFGTSRIGLAESTDGVHFKIRDTPVVEPDQWYEAEGGCEDPRVTEIDGKYFMTYTGYRYEDRTARLCLAVSEDLIHWDKKGPMFPDIQTEGNAKGWSKSGAMLPDKVNGEYLMYFGDSALYLARSKDAVHWTPDPEPVLRARPGYFDGNMVEPGPAPWLDANGDIHLLYNGDAPPPVGSDKAGGYAAGEVVFSGKDPSRIVSRSATPLLEVTEPSEKEGQVGNVIFLEGLARLNDQLLFYYGGADSKIFLATAPADPDVKGP